MMPRVKGTLAPVILKGPSRGAQWLEEPPLLFANDRTHPDPKVGIALYGPRSLGTSRHKSEVHVGFVGTGEAVEHARQFYAECAEGVAGGDQHIPFPGCKADRGFRTDLRFDSGLTELITRRESQEVRAMRRQRERFEAAAELLRAKVELLTRKDHPLDYVVVVLPEEFYERCRVADYYGGRQKVHRDLRLALKARAMKYHKPMQILLETTTGLVPSTRELDHKSKIAWNLFTGLYFKADGLPWGPTELPPINCFVGVSFFRPLGDSSSLRTSVVQAFDENGEGLVLRGHDFEWDEEKQGKSPHLSDELAYKLIEMVLKRYQEERKQLPQRVVLHKSSRFEPDERAGFEAALRSIGYYDLVTITPTSSVRLVRAGRYPPLRGTVFTVADCSYLYTNGYTPELGGFPHGHVPSPLEIVDHIGDTPKTKLLREVMVLSKMDWNSADFSKLRPITLEFSRAVGAIMREVPQDEEPQPKYKFYM